MLVIKNEYDTFATKTFRIPTELNEMLVKLADNHKTSLNKVVIQCLEFALENVDENEFLDQKER